jgi:tetratricopeptide (TPR) repeat protein
MVDWKYNKKTGRLERTRSRDVDYERIYNSCEQLVYLRDYDSVKIILDDALKKYPKSVPLLNIKAKILTRMKDRVGAFKVFDKITQIDPKNAKAWYLKGIMAERLGKTKIAQECYDQFITLDPFRQFVEETPEFAEKTYPKWTTDKRTIEQRKVELYFTEPEKLEEWDKALCNLFMIADPQVRNKLKTAFPEMHEEFIKSEKGIYKLIKFNEIHELRNMG